MRILPLSVRGILGYLISTLLIAVPTFVQIVDEREACAQRSHTGAESATEIQDSNNFLSTEGVVRAVTMPSIRVVEQGIGAELVMFIAGLVTGSVGLLRPRFLDKSGDELLRMAIGKLATR